MRNTIKKIQLLKNKRPISCLTAYSSSIAKIIEVCTTFDKDPKKSLINLLYTKNKFF